MTASTCLVADHRTGVGQVVKLVLDEVGVCPGHLIRCPCEYLDISSEELDKLDSLSFLQVHSRKKEMI